MSAVLFVSAVAIATFGAQSISLGQALYQLDSTALDGLMAWSTRHLGIWVWASLFQPVLARPAWLLPASAGIVCSGLSMSFSTRKTTHQSHRRS
jgi:hypothetical protein